MAETGTRSRAGKTRKTCMSCINRERALPACLLILAAITAPGSPDAAERAERADKKQALDHLVEYLQIDTSNPPGNETRGTEFFARIFDEAGIAWHAVESAPGRGNIWARLKGGDEPALVLLNHIDVVPADDLHWEHPVFSGKLADGKVYGRGALDMKGTAIIQLQSFLTLARNRASLNRDIIFAATADEEAGGNLGVRFLIENHPEIFEGAGFVLNEGGHGSFIGARPVFTVSVTQKTPLWLRLTASGESGHGSSPQVTSSVTRLTNALSRLAGSDFGARVMPVMQHYLAEIADLQPPFYRQAFRSIGQRIHDSDFMLRLQLENPGLAARLRNSCAVTRLGASSKINVVPTEAWAELDCRLLPDQNREDFIGWLNVVMNEPRLEFEQLLYFEPAASPVDTPLFASIQAVMQRAYPDALVLPSMMGGFTDSHWFRKLGLTSYGFTPMLISMEDAGGVHGNNERLEAAAFERGLDLLTDILYDFAVDK